MISRTSAYALEAVLVIARRHGQGPIRAAELAAELGLPGNYLSKILNSLARDGILASERGPTGGFHLALPADRLTIERVIGRFENVGAARMCFLGRGTCSEEHSCPMHDQWKEVSAPLFQFLRGTTMADLVESRSARASSTSPSSGSRTAHPADPGPDR